MTIRILAILIFVAVQASQLYFIAFLQNWTPLGIDTGPPSPLLRAALSNCALLALFGFVHSLMARPAFKKRLYGMVPHRLERSIYTLVSGALLAMIVLCWTPMPEELWRIESRSGVLAMYAAFAFGNLLLVWAIQSIDLWHFYGLRQAFSPAAPEPAFSTRGPYRYVRHPVQTGLIIALWVTPVMSIGHVLLAAFLTLYSVVATLFLEERELDRMLGETYGNYRRTVPALLPFFPPRR